jgi:hypothetical protein
MLPEPIRESDIQYLKELQPDGWPDIVPSFEFYTKNSFSNPVKIVIDNQIAGIGAGNTFGRTAWLSHIITRTEFRNRGIAASIVDHLHRLLINSGCETVSLIATDSGYPVYKKYGFTVQSEYLFLERIVPFNGLVESENIVSFSENYRSDIFALDKKISGEDRSRILVKNLDKAFIYIKNKKITGCYLPGLGEGLIIAEDPDSGIELSKLRCSVSGNTVLPCENEDGIRFLKSHGYLETKKVKRMISGKEFKWHPEKLFSRIAGNFG